MYFKEEKDRFKCTEQNGIHPKMVYQILLKTERIARHAGTRLHHLYKVRGFVFQFVQRYIKIKQEALMQILGETQFKLSLHEVSLTTYCSDTFNGCSDAWAKKPVLTEKRLLPLPLLPNFWDQSLTVG